MVCPGYQQHCAKQFQRVSLSFQYPQQMKKKDLNSGYQQHWAQTPYTKTSLHKCFNVFPLTVRLNTTLYMFV